MKYLQSENKDYAEVLVFGGTIFSMVVLGMAAYSTSNQGNREYSEALLLILGYMAFKNVQEYLKNSDSITRCQNDLDSLEDNHQQSPNLSSATTRFRGDVNNEQRNRFTFCCSIKRVILGRK